jgi:hypothetical protein
MQLACNHLLGCALNVTFDWLAFSGYFSQNKLHKRLAHQNDALTRHRREIARVCMYACMYRYILYYT